MVSLSNHDETILANGYQYNYSLAKKAILRYRMLHLFKTRPATLLRRLADQDGYFTKFNIHPGAESFDANKQVT
jgi:hypothetical protein